jgi:hypothetical protein
VLVHPRVLPHVHIHQQPGRVEMLHAGAGGRLVARFGDSLQARRVAGPALGVALVVFLVLLRSTTRPAPPQPAAFVQALSRFGCPEQVLTDNGKQFTGRFGKPGPAEVLFERICRRNGIRAILTKPRSPTTTGKVERFHQTLQGDCFAVHGPFPDLPAAQEAVDAFVAEYNHHRPHQALDDQPPGSRFAPIPIEQRHPLGLDVPAELSDSPPAPPEVNPIGTTPPMLDPDPWQVADAEDTQGF